MKRRGKTSKVISMITAVLCIVLVALSVSMISDVLFGSLKEPVIKISVKEGATASSVAKDLKDKGVIKHKLAFELFSTLKKANNRYYPNEFEIKKGSGYNTIINTLTYRSSYKTTNITIPEGATLKEITKIISSSGYVTEQECQEAFKKSYDYGFLPDADRENILEGYLFPDTYNISNQMKAEDIVDVMLKRFDEVFGEEYIKRADALGYNIDEIVTLASVIEAEAGSDADRKKVSSVFHNRLNSKTYPYLESCATVQYILGERKAILSAADTKIKSPYNTYINKGLPIGPICSPGKASIEAALYPENTQYYFFQSDKDGKIYYAKTLSEHETLRQKVQN